jgi:23S rRNA (adenine2503-C2)-methyltransferase
MNKIKLPTGYLIVDDYLKGQLETLSIGDYGKSKNIKADFLGYRRELSGVENGAIMPIQEKWVVTLSTQYGCAMKCNFCDVPNIKFRGNVSFNDLKKQLYTALAAFNDVTYTDRLNIHFARMGDPIFNSDVFNFSVWMRDNKQEIQDRTGVRMEVIHPVLTTMCPTYNNTAPRIATWAYIKNEIYNGQAGLQLSINSTSDKQRRVMFGGSEMKLADIAKMADKMPAPLGRKYCLNFAYASGSEVDGEKLAGMFDVNDWMVKITPIHNNTACDKNGIKTIGGYDSYLPYKAPEDSLKAAGFDTLVFIPSQDEEDGLVTCGNAILGGSKLKISNKHEDK